MSVPTASTAPSSAASSAPTGANFVYLRLSYPPGEAPLGVPPEAFPDGFIDCECWFSAQPVQVGDTYTVFDRAWTVVEVQTFQPEEDARLEAVQSAQIAVCAPSEAPHLPQRVPGSTLLCVPVRSDGSIGRCEDGAVQIGLSDDRQQLLNVAVTVTHGALCRCQWFRFSNSTSEAPTYEAIALAWY